MKNLILLSVLVLSVAVSLSAQEIPFVFDKNRIDVGTMYVYEYSKNKEDFEPIIKDYFYVKTLNDIEIIWISIKDTTAILFEKYKMNWDYMMFEKFEFLSLRKKDKLAIGDTPQASTEIDFSRKVLQFNVTKKYKDGFKHKNFNIRFETIPTYFYNLTDLMPLWFALRFYPLDKKEISVNHNTDGHNIKFGIKYMGKEDVEIPYGRILCYKFEVFPRMSIAMKAIFKPKKAWIWLTSEDDRMYMVKYRNNNIRSTSIRNMEYRLSEIKKMTPEEWEKFKKKCGVKSEVSK